MLLLLNLNQGPEWSSKDQSKERWMSFSVCCLDLSLRWRNFLDHDSGNGVPSSKASAAFDSTQLPTLIPTRTVPLGIPSQYPPIWVTLWMFVSVLPWFEAISIRPSMARGLRHSTPLKVKNHLEQQPRQKAILMSPLYSTFKAVLSACLWKTQS